MQISMHTQSCGEKPQIGDEQHELAAEHDGWEEQRGREVKTQSASSPVPEELVLDTPHGLQSKPVF